MSTERIEELETALREARKVVVAKLPQRRGLRMLIDAALMGKSR